MKASEEPVTWRPEPRFILPGLVAGGVLGALAGSVYVVGSMSLEGRPMSGNLGGGLMAGMVFGGAVGLAAGLLTGLVLTFLPGQVSPAPRARAITAASAAGILIVGNVVLLSLVRADQSAVLQWLAFAALPILIAAVLAGWLAGRFAEARDTDSTGYRP